MAVTQPAWAAVWVEGPCTLVPAAPGTYLFLGVGPTAVRSWWCCCPVPDVGWGGPVGTVYEGTLVRISQAPSKMKQWSALTPADAPPPGLLAGLMGEHD